MNTKNSPIETSPTQKTTNYNDLAAKLNVTPDRLLEAAYDLGHEIDEMPDIPPNIEAEIKAVFDIAANNDGKTDPPTLQLSADNGHNSKQFGAAKGAQGIAPRTSDDAGIEGMSMPQVPNSAATYWEAHQRQRSQIESFEAETAKMRGKLRAYELDKLESQAFVETEINILQRRQQALSQEFDRAINQSCEVVKSSEQKVRETAEKATKDWEKAEQKLPKQKDFLSQLLS